MSSQNARPDYFDYTYDMFITSVDGEESEIIRFSKWIDAASRDGVYTYEAPRLEAQKTEVLARRADGTPLKLLNFSSYNYLGYGLHPKVIESAKLALDRYGLGACSSPIQAGTLQLHTELEQRLADFVGLPNLGVSLFSSGYGVNTGAISALIKRGHHIVIDASCHMSIVEGAQLSRAKIHFFEHNNAEDLERVLKEIGPNPSRILVCSEGVFSADGDFGALDKIVPLAKSYGAQVLIDEAHSFLLCGRNGRGVADMLGVLDQVDYLVVTFSKALGGVGGALIAQREAARYVNWFARCRMFSCALDPAVTAGITKGLELGAGSDGDKRRARLKTNSDQLRSVLKGRARTGRSESWIVPVIFGSETLSIPLSDWLQRHGLEGSVMSFPAVPMDEARIRLFVTSEHSPEQIARCGDIVAQAASELGFAPRA
ncbi:MAG: aminotransferase class I/II-fold pyridoxal phosphate-dependent enzyme [Alphaproteobacteria bacterium]|nr:aminotransferase class I/II-fold pyridoxal phosphate-dependent enzyme [Alphaproteobacteria bacterium]